MYREGQARALPIVEVPNVATFKAYEWVTAVLVAMSAIGSLGVALKLTSMKRADILEMPKTDEEPVKIIPQIDEEALAKLGNRADYKLPDAWQRSKPKPVVEEKAFVSTKASQKEEDIPKPEIKVADAGTEVPQPDASTAPSAEPTTESTTAPTSTSEALPSDSDAGPAAAATGVAGDPDGVQGGQADGLLKGAAARYVQALSSFFSRGFVVHGTGLSQDELTKLRVSATVTMSSDGTVTGFTISSSGNATFDAAARSLLEGKKGDKVPDPPDDYPQLRKTSFSLGLSCPVNKCD